MDQRTREYLRGRFGDYYRSASVDPPPAAGEREWGHIPWTAGSGTTMVRHQSLLDVGEVGDYLEREAPRHAYFSAARYDDPSASTMSGKGWRGADLVFDLDADHLPGVDPDETDYAEMLATCKDALLRLLDLLEEDFAFERARIVFSGRRGYHVHVRDASVRDLDSESRREIVDYVRGIDLDPDALIRTAAVGGTTHRELHTEGGWGRRTHRRLVAFVEDLLAAEEDAAIKRLREFDGIGESRATTILGALRNNPDAVREGNVEVGGPGLRRLVRKIAEETVAEESSPIDEPVTTDAKRLIRLPGSLHGGTGFVVRPIPRDEVEAFDPLVDAVPRRFREREIAIRAEEPRTVELLGESTKISRGQTVVPECVGVFLMTRGAAEKARE